MPVYVDGIEQGSLDWLRLRLAIPTASRFDSLITPAKGEPSKAAEGYMHELLAEWITGQSAEGAQTVWMLRGQEFEAEARKFYAFERETQVRQVAFVYGDESKRYGCSPDGLIGDDGGLEMKIPKPAVHVGYLLAGDMPDCYRPQVQGSMMVTGRAWWDFMSYSPGLPPLLVRVQRDEEYIGKIRKALDVLLDNFEKAKGTLISSGYGPRKEAA